MFNKVVTGIVRATIDGGFTMDTVNRRQIVERDVKTNIHVMPGQHVTVVTKDSPTNKGILNASEIFIQ